MSQALSSPSAELRAAIAECAFNLRRYAMHLTRNPSDADDLVQDCIERALRKSHQFRIGTNLQQWMVTIMRSLFINDIRKQKLARTYADHRKLTGDVIVQPSQQDSVEFQEFTQAFRRLSSDHRETIRLFAIEQRSHKEAADVMGVAVATAKTRLFRARENLGRMMDGHR
jgi:RNA polymerase sigma-70 factor (ECF subfamily)